ncbi:6,7-dimethyl-8-ribityllumazine synthase [Candidatus Liberibacter asiaticus]|uniref:6,7-dimethyl-8-ribityllumazine synthase n=2 Tax=Liberibacter asiaticus TaxID=34021 RepID=C6XHS6_LIBAP|nr:6,7-dimethyl-8-ribityllumazine synthase [Candidatus Liberibacter asiaticus]ACT56819.1 riboflavin synthase subunit beta [Candidatus Liberibacter asiaticus str. psy62]AGH16586.1 riboflavin synthase subunit beta [Candidatus Liberibacter asiaticus str. gxpsy]ALK06977.1 6,7-dimethyl-8-ribityllumazine synthase [Candidatus Liberibacter asiaticus]ASK52447.1 6,7-dimethyl-8-ribityllumazine synthase [Candidatus Liberibacter asiaticus]AWL13774.1 6,7-dimethyl-8-ribityllumazine synthase [Candidatus Liber
MEVFIPHVLIIEARFYENLSAMLFEGCVNVLHSRAVQWSSIVTPGVLEIPAAVSMVMNAKTRSVTYDGIIVLGVVMRGKTAHCDVIAHAVTRGLVDLSINGSLPIGNGIVVVDSEQQAFDRVSPSHLDRGGCAARSALAMIELKKSLSE